MGPLLFMGPWSKSSEPSVKGQRSWCLYVVQSLFLVQTRLLFKESYRGVLVITSKHVHPPSPSQSKPSAARPGGGRSATSIVPPTSTHMRSDNVFTSMLLYVSDVVCGVDSSNTGELLQSNTNLAQFTLHLSKILLQTWSL